VTRVHLPEGRTCDWGPETEIRDGNPDLQGLCLALSDWSAELHILQDEKSRRGETPAASVNGLDRAQPLIE
jgi:hypothetical protein